MTESGTWQLAVEPRAWQREALELWERKRQRGIVSVVTGAGKTVFAELCMLAFRARYPTERIVIVVPTLALLDQWYVSLREDLGVPDEQIATYSGESKATEPAEVNLMVLNTARSFALQVAESGKSFLIVDEVHRAVSPINSLALEGEWRATLGMSATPEREYDTRFEDFAVPTLGELIYWYDYRRAVQDGVISQFSLVNVEIDLLPEEQEAYDALTRKVSPLLRKLQAGEDVQEGLRRLLQQRASVSASATLRIPVAVKLAEQHRSTRTLLFHERIEAAEQIWQTLELRGFNATIYHSKIAPVLRRDNLRLFRQGVFDDLVTCRALDEGVNVPETAVAVIASSTASTRQRIQRLGRVLRPAPGKQVATVYTIYATEVERRRLEREAEVGVGAESVSWVRGSLSSYGSAAD